MIRKQMRRWLLTCTLFMYVVIIPFRHFKVVVETVLFQSSNQMIRWLLSQKKVNLLLGLWCGVDGYIQVKLLEFYL